MTTNNAVNTNLSGQTGTGNFVGATSPTMITPNIGVATATSVVFSPTTSGMIGTTTNNLASTGIVGELITSIIPQASEVQFTANATPQNLTSISLTAGDWDIWGNITYIAATPANLTGILACINTTSATLPDVSLFVINAVYAPAAINNLGVSAASRPFQFSSTTTVYLIGQIQATATAVYMCGGIYARRRR